MRKMTFMDYWESTHTVPLTSPTTIEQDIEWLTTQAVYVCQFRRAEETPWQQQRRVLDQKRRMKNPFYLGAGLFGLTAGSMFWACILGSIPLFDSLKGTVASVPLLLIPAIISLYFIVKYLRNTIIDKSKIYIDNTSYDRYELRKMSNGQLVLIPLANFDGNNPLAKDPLIPSIPTRPFSRLYLLEYVAFYETNSHIIIDCDALVKYMNRITPDTMVYLQANHPEKCRRIYIQKGAYPDDMLMALGYPVQRTEEE